MILKPLLKYSNDLDGIDKNIEEYNPNKKRKYQMFWMIGFLISLAIKKLIHQ